MAFRLTLTHISYPNYDSALGQRQKGDGVIFLAFNWGLQAMLMTKEIMVIIAFENIAFNGLYRLKERESLSCRRALNYQAFIRISEARMHAPIEFVSPLGCIFSVVNIYMIYGEFNDAHCGFIPSYNELRYAGVTV